jgi:H+-transporting ATPase
VFVEDFVLSKFSWLDNLGRITRHKKNTKLENFLSELQRLTLVHEGHSDDGSDHYRFASGAPSKPSDVEEDKPQKAKGKDAKGKGDTKKSEK